jgi:hypothetical protein
MKRHRASAWMAAAAACACLSFASAAKDPEELVPEDRSFALSVDGEDLSLQSAPSADSAAEATEPEQRGVGLPTFTGSFVARGQTYRFTMVGSSPILSRPRRVVVPVQIIPVRVEFNDGTALDPTRHGPPCAGPKTPLINTLESPLFTDTDYGDGPRQYVEENRRFEFWSLIRTRPDYSVRVVPIVLHRITLAFDGPSSPAACGRIGVLPNAWLDGYIRQSLLPPLRRGGSARVVSGLPLHQRRGEGSR